MVNTAAYMPMRPHSISPVICLPKAPQAAIQDMEDIRVSETSPRLLIYRPLLCPGTTITAGITPCYHKRAPWIT